MVAFIPGMELARDFFEDIVEPLLPGALALSAGLIGPGSEVLGFDSEMSTNHDWGPRVMIFLSASDHGRAERIAEVLRRDLPREFRGYPTNFSQPDPDDKGSRRMQTVSGREVNHRVEFLGLNRSRIGSPCRCSD